MDYGEVWTGAVLFADASGFTQLTERLTLEVKNTVAFVFIIDRYVRRQTLYSPNIDISITRAMALRNCVTFSISFLRSFLISCTITGEMLLRFDSWD